MHRCGGGPIRFLQLDGTLEIDVVVLASKLSSAGQIATGVPYPWTDSTDPDDLSVFDAVESILKGSVYAGTSKQIQKSYARVTARIKRGEGWRYYPSKYVQFPGHFRTAEEEKPR